MKNRIGNRSRANFILGAVFILFVLATVLRLIVPHDFFTDMLAFTAECALVGGIADWFAVTALFKKPLGFPWHTAIIPKNRDMIVEKVSELVGSELLSIEAIRSSLGSVDLADIVIGRISGSHGEISLESRIAEFFTSRAGSLDKEKISEGIDSFVLVSITDGATFSNIPNGRYVDAITGDIKNVTNGTLVTPSVGKGNMRVYVLDLPNNGLQASWVKMEII
jgi:uncharacterized membrane-anchored protein YjiN (DUF445 family)